MERREKLSVKCEEGPKIDLEMGLERRIRLKQEEIGRKDKRKEF